MSSGDRKQQQTIKPIEVVRTNHDGLTMELRFSTRDLEPPTRTFFANTITRVDQRERGPGVLAFSFGQLAAGRSDVVHATIGIEIPGVAVPAIRMTLPDLEPSLEIFRKRSMFFPPYPTNTGVPTTMSYPAHLTKIALNDFLANIDFYTIMPKLREMEVIPAVRLQVFPPVLDYFVSAVSAWDGGGS